MFDVTKGRENPLEWLRLGQVHVAHRLVVAAKGCLPFGRGHEPERRRDGQVVAGPGAAEEATLPADNTLAQIRLRNSAEASAWRARAAVSA